MAYLNRSGEDPSLVLLARSRRMMRAGHYGKARRKETIRKIVRILII
jgi:hypothetical protein